jgi:hypothetical protein
METVFLAALGGVSTALEIVGLAVMFRHRDRWPTLSWSFLLMALGCFGSAVFAGMVGQWPLVGLYNLFGVANLIIWWKTRPPRRRRPIRKIIGEKSRALLAALAPLKPQPGVN